MSSNIRRLCVLVDAISALVKGVESVDHQSTNAVTAEYRQ